MWKIFIAVYLCEFYIQISPSPQKRLAVSTAGLFCDQSLSINWIPSGSILIIFCL